MSDALQDPPHWVARPAGETGAQLDDRIRDALWAKCGAAAVHDVLILQAAEHFEISANAVRACLSACAGCGGLVALRVRRCSQCRNPQKPSNIDTSGASQSAVPR